MKNYRTVLRGIAALLLLFGLAFVGCSDDSGGGGGGDSGGARSTLTISNAPKTGSVSIFEGETPSNMEDYARLISSLVSKAIGSNPSGDKETYPLGNTAGPFTETGSFLVLYMDGIGGPAVGIYVIGEVSFTDGGAKVDFNDMKKLE